MILESFKTAAEMQFAAAGCVVLLLSQRELFRGCRGADCEGPSVLRSGRGKLNMLPDTIKDNKCLSFLIRLQNTYRQPPPILAVESKLF